MLKQHDGELAQRGADGQAENEERDHDGGGRRLRRTRRQRFRREHHTRGANVARAQAEQRD